MSHFITQNKLIAANQHKNENATVLPLGILGIANGCIDTRVEAFGYPHLAYNNTYGIQVYNESMYNEVMQQVVAPKTGCYDAVDECRALAKEGDPHGYGNNETVNQACLFATEACFGKVLSPYMEVSNVSKEKTHRRAMTAHISNIDFIIRHHLPQHYIGCDRLLQWVLQPTLGAGRLGCPCQLHGQ